MTDIEKKIADFIIKNYDEEEYSEPYQDYRVYIDGNHLIASQGEMTDVLFVHYTENEETGDKYIQVFLSSPDDMEQEFVYLTSLTESEQTAVVKQIFAECETRSNK